MDRMAADRVGDEVRTATSRALMVRMVSKPRSLEVEGPLPKRCRRRSSKAASQPPKRLSVPSFVPSQTSLDDQTTLMHDFECTIRERGKRGKKRRMRLKSEEEGTVAPSTLHLRLSSLGQPGAENVGCG